MKKKLIPTKNRPVTNISLNIPADLPEKPEKVAALKQMAGHRSLIKYYVGQGLLRDADLLRKVEFDADEG